LTPSRSSSPSSVSTPSSASTLKLRHHWHRRTQRPFGPHFAQDHLARLELASNLGL
jgi:hypothetical protein